MDDRANLAFAALPERLYVVREGRVVFEVSLVGGLRVDIAQGGMGPFDYKIGKVEEFLKKEQ